MEYGTRLKLMVLSRCTRVRKGRQALEERLRDALEDALREYCDDGGIDLGHLHTTFPEIDGYRPLVRLGANVVAEAFSGSLKNLLLLHRQGKHGGG